jgi:sugar lactone lactonase YvrE
MFLANVLWGWALGAPRSAGKPRVRAHRRTPPPVLEALEGRLCPSGGSLLVSNFGGNDVLRFDETTGAFLGTLVAPGSGGLSTPRGLDYGPDGNLVVLSGPFLPFTTIPSPGGNGQDEVLRFDRSTGAFLGTLVKDGDLADARALVFGHDQKLYVSNDANGTDKRGKDVESYDGTTGTFRGHFVTPNSGGLNHPQGLVFGPDGNLYVSDAYSRSIMRYDGVTGAPLPGPGNSGALFVSQGSGDLEEGQGIVFGPDGNLYVADGQTGQVLRYDGQTGAPLPSAGNTGATFIPADSMGDPRAGLIFGPDGDLYVTSAVAGTDLVAVLRFDGTTGAPLPSAGNSGATFIPAGSGGLSGLPTYLIFTETDPTTLAYEGAISAAARTQAAPSPRSLASPRHLGSFTASPNPVAAGSRLTLTASNLSGATPGTAITQAAFDVQNQEADRPLGHDVQTNSGTWAITCTANLAPGTDTLVARARDSFDIFGDPRALTLSECPWAKARPDAV